MMLVSVAMMLLCVMLGGFMIRSCMGKRNSVEEVKKAGSDIKKIIDKKSMLKFKGENRPWT